MDFSRIKYCDLRKYWKNETSHFSKWLIQKENLILLSETVGINLEFIKKEATNKSRLRLDILARNIDTGDYVIIENQLEETDHSHLGQIITYATQFQSKVIIWIVKDIRPEHELAISWLNNNTKDGVNIYLIRIQVIKIGNSKPAPLFTIISKPYNFVFPKVRQNIEKEYEENLFALEDLKSKFLDKRIFDFFNETVFPGNTYIKKVKKRNEIGLIDLLYKYNFELGIKYEVRFSRYF